MSTYPNGPEPRLGVERIMARLEADSTGSAVVAQRSYTPKVGGSNPSPWTNFLFPSNSMVEYGFNTNDVLFVSQSSTATHLMLCCGCLYTHDIDICGVHKHLKCHELVWLVKRGDH